jgi:hypothetical protein
MPQALTPVTLTDWPTANVVQLAFQKNEQGELQITGKFQGADLNQTVPVQIPCMLFIDPSNNNMQAFNDLREVNPSWLLLRGGVLKQAS